MSKTHNTPRALTIAGSDSGGGAGIQADLKAFARCGVHGTSAITAITAQNTLGVSAIHPIPAGIILAQVRAVIADIGVDAVKVGMLGTVEAARVVAQALDELPAGTPVVVDPVMVAESGAQLLDPDAQDALVAEILPRATILTPNVPEARALARHAPAAKRQASEDDSVSAPPRAGDSTRTVSAPGVGSSSTAGQLRSSDADCEDDTEAHSLVRAVLALGPKIVVLTGGHRAQAIDLFLDSSSPDRIVSIPGERHPGGAAHGSGCTHSSVLAAQLALGRAPLQAAFAARALAGRAVADGLRDVGEGPGPVDVIGLVRLRPRSE
ncbi:MAG: bifunctional hydroxymethylpyrimidine kinase/phosphomethylpyrimidine kinase [Solirubrobacteraceae bacterium]